MNFLRFSYPKPDLSTYSNGYKGKCTISYVDHNADEPTYIIDHDRYLDFILYDELLDPLKMFPEPNVIFAVDQGDEGIYRAVCESHTKNPFLALTCAPDKKRIFFIDVGEVIEVDSNAPKDIQMFEITSKAQEASSSAIPCRIIEIRDECGQTISIDKNLRQLWLDDMYFIVKNVEHDMLEVVLSKIAPDDLHLYVNGYKLTQEEIDILNEVPETTTNALKAILGYVPTDEKRICPFYDSDTGRCFKGNSCRLEHIQPLTDGTTRDRRVHAFYLTPSIIPRMGTTVIALIASFITIDEFYIYIPANADQANTSLKALKEKLKNAKHRLLERQPADNELVIVKKNGEFYRGRILEQYDDSISVFLIDYGRTIDDLNKLDDEIYEWHSEICNFIPALAYRCSLANAVSNENSDEAQQFFQCLIEEQFEVHVEIVESQYDELFVKLFDADGLDLGVALCENQLATAGEKLIPISDMIPV